MKYTIEELKAYATAALDWLNELKDSGADSEDINRAENRAKFYSRELERRLSDESE